MSTYFLCDPISILPDPGNRPESALKLLVEIPDRGDTSLDNVRLTTLEAIKFKYGPDFFEPCSKSTFPIVERSDVRPLLRA